MDMDMHYLQVVTSVSAMQREMNSLTEQNNLLTKGAANQAKTIRLLQEQLSVKDTEVQVQQYNVEFVKQQARKSRFKNREKLQGWKAKVASLLQRVMDLTAQVDHLRAQVSTHEKRAVSAEDRLESVGREHKMAMERIQSDRELPFTIQIDRFPFKVTRYSDLPAPRYFSREEPVSFEPVPHYEMMRVAVVQSAIQLQIAPEHHRDATMHLELARRAAAELTGSVEQQILNAIRGEPTSVAELEEKRHRQAMQMRQQQQTYGTGPGQIHPRWKPFDCR